MFSKLLQRCESSVSVGSHEKPTAREQYLPPCPAQWQARQARTQPAAPIIALTRHHCPARTSAGGRARQYHFLRFPASHGEIANAKRNCYRTSTRRCRGCRFVDRAAPGVDMGFSADRPRSEALTTAFVRTGEASWYGPGFHGRRTASGEIFDQNALTAAHRTLPLGTKADVTGVETGKSVQVTINDRGPT